ncbi:MAG: membrane dipeptidase [Deltaproteobacteria bacterium]|nr:membrane dipeptidase [Deltaproteobacteria bacterium]
MRFGLLMLALGLSACAGATRAGEPAAPPPPAPTRAAVVEAPEPVPEPEAIAAPRRTRGEPLLIGIDTHIDTTQRLLDDHADLFDALVGGHVDAARMRAGGLSGAFFSIYVSPRRFASGDPSYARALALTRRVRELAAAHPDEAALCTTASDVRQAAREGKIAMLMGVEGAHALGTADRELALKRLRELFDLGNRYMTITWSTDNPLGHSSSGEHPELGLTPLGRVVVREMNRLGMIVDVSHVSDRTFWDIMELTDKPVLASHSSSRALADNRRNMTDAMITRVAEGGGAVCVNFYPQFLDADYRRARRRLRYRHRAEFAAVHDTGTYWVDRGPAERALALRLEPALRPPTVETLVDHFAHIVEIAGPGAACMGSDFDGVPELPVGMHDVGDLGVLREALARRGLPVRAIWGENVLRVLEANASH